MPTTTRRRTAATLGFAALASTALALTAPVASAHVSPTDDELVAGSSGLVELGVSHGCGESGTVRLAIQIPDGINAVTPTVNPGWGVEKVMEQLPEPVVDAHGTETTERVDHVVYSTATPLPHDLRTTFTLSLQVPDTPGATLYFPVVQTCEEGETAWIQIPAEGQDPEELDDPAPVFHVVAGEGDEGHDHAEEATDDTATDEAAVEEAAVDGAPVAATTDDDDGTDALTVVALVVGVLGLAVGGVALVSSRR